MNSKESEGHREGMDFTLNGYRTFYGEVQKSITNRSYIVDFTHVFENHEGASPFYDDCHITDDYQLILSDSIYQVLLRRGYLESTEIKN